MDSMGMRHVESCTEAGILSLRKAISAMPGSSLYVLCDPTLDDPLHRGAEKRGLPLHTVRIPSRPGVPRPKPYWIQVDDYDAHEFFVNESVRLSVAQALSPAPPNRRSRSICAWLMASESLDDMSEVIASISAMSDPRGRRRIFRFWDPRTTQHMKRLFPGRESVSWLPRTSWCFVDAFGEWQSLSSNDESVPYDAPPRWYELQACNLINAVLQLLSIAGMRHRESVIESVQDALRAGRRVGLVDDEECVAFAAHRVEMAAPIELSVKVAEILATTRKYGVGYRSLMDELEQDEWTAIRAEARSLALREQGAER